MVSNFDDLVVDVFRSEGRILFEASRGGDCFHFGCCQIRKLQPHIVDDEPVVVADMEEVSHVKKRHCALLKLHSRPIK